MNQTTQTSAGGSVPDFDLTQFYQVFFEEAGENLTRMESLLLEIDVASPDDEELNAIFRCAHSIKGGAATFGFADVADLTHVMETLLDRLRRHELSLNSGMVDVLLESGDALQGLLARHQGTSDEVIDASDLVARIRAHVEGRAAATAPSARPAPAPAAAPEPAPAPAPEPEPAPPEAAAPAASPAQPPVDGARTLDIAIGPLQNPSVADDLVGLFSDIPGLGTITAADGGSAGADGRRRFRAVTSSSNDELIDLFTFHVPREQVEIVEAAPQAPAASPAAPEARPQAEADASYGFFVDIEPSPAAAQAPSPAPAPAGVDAPAPAAAPAPTASPIVAAPAAASTPERPKAGGARTERSSAGVDGGTLRVSVEKVDQLINLVGELVITQAMLAQTGRGLDQLANQQLTASLADLERNTRLLQEAVMAIRMIPMAAVFSRFPRMLRDLAAKLGKQVELHTVGEATELDKGMVEKITDPLTHLVRNALDHGIESPEERIAKGKPACGAITLAAEHKGGSIVIEVRDDGKGLPREKILAKARERGMQVNDRMSDQEVWQLIWEPGFSTAEQVTDVSGRGVGMDVVRKNILSLGGSVELDAAENCGTRVIVRLPLTLAIMDGMSVGVADETYILPLGSVVESIRLEQQRVKVLSGSHRVVEVRGEWLPVVPLDSIFGVPRFREREGEPIMIVVEAEGARIGMLVDELLGQHQVVVKNLEANYRRVAGISGATILGDGRVALIVDVAHLVRMTRH